LGSAGYGWYVDNLDKEHLELVSKETKVISKGEVGAPVMGVWLFEAKKKGSSEIKMDYYRVWEGKDKATEHFSIKLTIE
jgi:predicted secreted protein